MYEYITSVFIGIYVRISAEYIYTCSSSSFRVLAACESREIRAYAGSRSIKEPKKYSVSCFCDVIRGDRGRGLMTSSGRTERLVC